LRARGIKVAFRRTGQMTEVIESIHHFVSIMEEITVGGCGPLSVVDVP